MNRPRKSSACVARMSRRGFLASTALGASGIALGRTAFAADSGESAGRNYHLSISVDALDADPELIDIVGKAGVTDIWLASFFYGYWQYPPERLAPWLRRLEDKGFGVHVINVPLGHPGDSLGSTDGSFPLTPPTRWKPGVRPDGATYAGTSLHPPATEENCAALKRIKSELKVDRVFLDDDFRLARGPGVIGGCFCDEHKKEFLQKGGYGDTDWSALLESVNNRQLTPVLRAWVEFTCDRLTGAFKAQQDAAPDIQLGNMIMFMGAEKAGIRLDEYRNVPFRVGELMFNDASFDPVKGKTDELFSALFHRRFAQPELAFSETTAYPADQLSAANMAAKLAVSTISDCRNTMFMSGLTPFPKTHWETLAPAMKRQAEQHAVLAGHVPRGPFKHFWGEFGRKVGDDNPFSLFLAAGIPFEVVDKLPQEGWVFFGDHDARCLPASGGATYFARPESGFKEESVRALPETLDALFNLKHEIASSLMEVPYVEDDKPVVCAWYPTARAVLLWNLSNKSERFTLRIAQERRTVEVNPLDTELVSNI